MTMVMAGRVAGSRISCNDGRKTTEKEIAQGDERRKMLSESKREMVNYLSRKK